MNSNFEQAKSVVDIVSLSALVGVILNYLPAATAFLTFVWVALRVYESVLSIRRLRRDE